MNNAKVKLTAQFSSRGYSRTFNVLDDLALEIAYPKDNVTLGVVTAEKTLERETSLTNRLISEYRNCEESKMNDLHLEICEDLKKKIKMLRNYRDELLNTKECRVYVSSELYKNNDGKKCLRVAKTRNLSLVEFTNKNMVDMFVDKRDIGNTILLGLTEELYKKAVDLNVGNKIMSLGVFGLDNISSNNLYSSVKGFLNESYFKDDLGSAVIADELFSDKLKGLVEIERVESAIYYSSNWLPNNITLGIKAFLCDMYGLSQVKVTDEFNKSIYVYLKGNSDVRMDGKPVGLPDDSFDVVEVKLNLELNLDGVDLVAEKTVYVNAVLKDLIK